MTATAVRRPGAAGTIAWAASQAGVVLPARVRAWDGSEAGPPAGPTVVLRSPLALRRILWRPVHRVLRGHGHAHPPVGETVGLLGQAGLEVLGVESLRSHYVRTIGAWLDNLERNFSAVEAIIGAERARLWRLYLAGGALAFEEGRMGVDQILAARRG
jgi:Mycolic acid cyclopropane synthetase